MPQETDLYVIVQKMSPSLDKLLLAKKSVPLSPWAATVCFYSLQSILCPR